MGIADFIIKLTMDTAGVSKGSDKAKAEVNNLASKIEGSVSKIGALKEKFAGVFNAVGGLRGTTAVTALLGIVNAIGNRFDAIVEKSRTIGLGQSRTGLDSQAFQRGSTVFDAKGSSAEAFEHSLEKTADAIQAIRDNQDEGAKLQTAFARLGVTLDDIKKKNHQQVFFEIAENMKNMEVTAEKLASLKDIFGKNAGELIPGFKAGLDGKLANRGLLSEEQLKQADEARAEEKALSQGGDDLLTASPLGKFIRRGKDLVKHPFGALAAIFFGAAKVDGSYDDSEFSAPGQEQRQQEMQAKLLEKQTKKAKDEAEKAAKKKETDKARDLSIKNATKLNEMRISALGKGAEEIALKKRSADLVDEIRGTAPGEERERLRAELLENESKLAAIKPEMKGYSLARPSDALSKIGLFRGGAEAASERIWVEQLQVQRLALSEQRRTVQRLDQLRNDLTSYE